MSNYSYSEIQSMQKKALERVREMRKNSEKLLEETDSTPYIKPKHFFEESSQQVKPKITNMPPNFPQNTSYPDFKEFFIFPCPVETMIYIRFVQNQWQHNIFFHG